MKIQHSPGGKQAIVREGNHKEMQIGECLESAEKQIHMRWLFLKRRKMKTFS